MFKYSLLNDYYLYMNYMHVCVQVYSNLNT